MSTDVEQPRIEEDVPIDDIMIDKRRRAVDKAFVKKLAESIQEVGLLHRITLTVDYGLIEGGHRLAAYQLLGWKTIPATLYTRDQIDAQIAEIDENIMRLDLDALDESNALDKRKSLYLAKHPETAHGKAPAKKGGKGGKKKQGKEPESGSLPSTPSFVEDTATKTRRGKTQITLKVGVAGKIAEDVQEKIKGTKLAKNLSQLKKLGDLTKPKQRSAVTAYLKGDTKAITEADTARKEALKPKPVAPNFPTSDAFLANIEQTIFWILVVEQEQGSITKMARKKTWDNRFTPQAVELLKDAIDGLSQFHKELKQ